MTLIGSHFTVQEIERTVTWYGEDDYTDEDDPGKVEPANLREALDALRSQCWDDMDNHGDGTLVLFPADQRMNAQTGAYESTHLIVKGEPHNIERLLRFYYNTEGR